MKPFFIKSVLLASALLCAMTSRAEQRSTKVIFYSDSIVRIVKGDVPEGSFAVTMDPQSVKFKTRHSQAGTEYTSSSVKVKVDASGNVSFYTAKGKALVKEGGCSFTERKEGLDKGSFPGMLSARKFRIVCISDGGTSTRDVDYTGKEVRIKL